MTDHLPAATAEAIARLVALAKKTRGVGGLLLGVEQHGQGARRPSCSLGTPDPRC